MAKRFLVVTLICVMSLALSGVTYAASYVINGVEVDDKYIVGSTELAEEIEWEEVAIWQVTDEGNLTGTGLWLDYFWNDGRFYVVEKGGHYAVETVKGSGWMFLYFIIGNDVIHELPDGTPVRVEVEYYDEGMGSLVFGPTSWLADGFYWSDPIRKQFADEWKVGHYILTRAKFDGSGFAPYYQYDFRIQAADRNLAIRRVSIFLEAE